MFKSKIGDYMEGPSVEDLIEAAAAEAEAELKGKRGSARAQLLGHEEQLLLMLRKRLPLRKQVETLKLFRPPINVTAVSLRNFLITEFPEQWADYLAETARGRKENRVYRDGSKPTDEELQAPLTPVEQAEVEQFLGAATSETQVKPTTPSAKKPPLTAGDLRAMTDQIDHETYRPDE